jgi:hypothetical protein
MDDLHTKLDKMTKTVQYFADEILFEGNGLSAHESFEQQNELLRQLGKVHLGDEHLFALAVDLMLDLIPELEVGPNNTQNEFDR